MKKKGKKVPLFWTEGCNHKLTSTIVPWILKCTKCNEEFYILRETVVNHLRSAIKEYLKKIEEAENKIPNCPLCKSRMKETLVKQSSKTWASVWECPCKKE